MPFLFALALAAPLAVDPHPAMERCAMRVMQLRHPGGMVDASGIKFEWLQASTAGAEWVIIGAIIESERGERVARRFTCRTRGDRTPRVTFAAVIKLME